MTQLGEDSTWHGKKTYYFRLLFIFAFKFLISYEDLIFQLLQQIIHLETLKPGRFL